MSVRNDDRVSSAKLKETLDKLWEDRYLGKEPTSHTVEVEHGEVTTDAQNFFNNFDAEIVANFWNNFRDLSNGTMIRLNKSSENTFEQSLLKLRITNDDETYYFKDVLLFRYDGDDAYSVLPTGKRHAALKFLDYGGTNSLVEIIIYPAYPESEYPHDVLRFVRETDEETEVISFIYSVERAVSEDENGAIHTVIVESEAYTETVTVKDKHTIKQDFLPNADWNVNDPEADGYVEGRTHWVEKVIKTISLGNAYSFKNDAFCAPIGYIKNSITWNPQLEPDYFEYEETGDTILVGALLVDINDKQLHVNSMDEISAVINDANVILISQYLANYVYLMGFEGGDSLIPDAWILEEKNIHKLDPMFYHTQTKSEIVEQLDLVINDLSVNGVDYRFYIHCDSNYNKYGNKYAITSVSDERTNTFTNGRSTPLARDSISKYLTFLINELPNKFIELLQTSVLTLHENNSTFYKNVTPDNAGSSLFIGETPSGTQITITRSPDYELLIDGSIPFITISSKYLQYSQINMNPVPTFGTLLTIKFAINNNDDTFMVCDFFDNHFVVRWESSSPAMKFNYQNGNTITMRTNAREDIPFDSMSDVRYIYAILDNIDLEMDGAFVSSDGTQLDTFKCVVSTSSIAGGSISLLLNKVNSEAETLDVVFPKPKIFPISINELSWIPVS